MRHLDFASTVCGIGLSASVVWLVALDPRARPARTSATTAPAVVLPEEPQALIEGTTRGSSSAPAVLVVFSDFQCPACGASAKETLPEIERAYVRPGHLRLAYRHLPLERLHAEAVPAAIAAECAGMQGRFWDMHDDLFLNQRQLDPGSIIRRAERLSLDVGSFKDCLMSPPTARIQRDVAIARQLGVTTTPTFIVGLVDADGRVRIRQHVTGSLPFRQLRHHIEAVLQEHQNATPGRSPKS